MGAGAIWDSWGLQGLLPQTVTLPHSMVPCGQPVVRWAEGPVMMAAQLPQPPAVPGQAAPQGPGAVQTCFPEAEQWSAESLWLPFQCPGPEL